MSETFKHLNNQYSWDTYITVFLFMEAYIYRQLHWSSSYEVHNIIYKLIVSSLLIIGACKTWASLFYICIWPLSLLDDSNLISCTSGVLNLCSYNSNLIWANPFSQWWCSLHYNPWLLLILNESNVTYSEWDISILMDLTQNYCLPLLSALLLVEDCVRSPLDSVVPFQIILSFHDHQHWRL